MGRNAKPVSLHLANGNKRCLTKAEIERRQELEIKLGEKKFTCPDNVKDNAVAFKKWNELIKLYKDIDFVTNSDTSLMEKYCLAHADLLALRKAKSIEFERYLNGEISFETYNKLEQAVNKKMDILIKMEDRLFLNPVSRIKNVPKKEKEQEDPSVSMFGG